MEDVKYPPMNFSGGGEYSVRATPDIFPALDRKLLPTHPISKKLLYLHFSRLLVHKSHIECTSFSRSHKILITIEVIIFVTYN